MRFLLFTALLAGALQPHHSIPQHYDMNKSIRGTAADDFSMAARPFQLAPVLYAPSADLRAATAPGQRCKQQGKDGNPFPHGYSSMPTIRLSKQS
jgi:hypothetical protein